MSEEKCGLNILKNKRMILNFKKLHFKVDQHSFSYFFAKYSPPRRQSPDYSSPSLSQLRLSRYWLCPVPGREEMPEALQEHSQNCVWIQPVPRLKLNRIQFTVYFHIVCTFLKLTSYFLKDVRMQRLKMAL